MASQAEVFHNEDLRRIIWSFLPKNVDHVRVNLLLQKTNQKVCLRNIGVVSGDKLKINIILIIVIGVVIMFLNTKFNF